MKKWTFTLFTAAASLYAALLDVPLTVQEKDMWCWAGSSQAVLSFYGDRLSQGQIVLYSYGDSTVNQGNKIWGHTTAQTWNGKTYYPHGINEIMDHWNTPNELFNRGLTEAEFKKEIDDLHPFFVRWVWDAGGAHYVVGMGYLSNGNYQVMDPWPGNGFTVGTFSYINKAKNKGSWGNTLKTNRSSTYLLTVTGGTGEGAYAPNSKVTIKATVPSGFKFQKWSGGGTAIVDSTKESTTLKMPAKNITISAQFIPMFYQLTVNGGEGSGEYSFGREVEIKANETSGQLFAHWSGAGEAIADSLKAETTVKIPLRDLTVTAIYKEDATAVEQLEQINGVQIWSVGRTLYLNHLHGKVGVELFSLTGALLWKRDISADGSPFELQLPNSAKGITVLQVKWSGGAKRELHRGER